MASTYRKEMLESEIMKVLTVALSSYTGHNDSLGMTSIVRVELSKDKRFATIFVSLMGPDDRKKKLVEKLNEDKGIFRTAIAKNIRLFKAPEIRFKEDIGIEASLRVAQLLEQIEKEKKESNNE
ncbi:ribosome-binding factor A [Mesotoga sp. Brook.08.YT.4.2.5.1]|uniref:30S ribosome-binding factor RbfA n=1 Tax=unclassified Mesotoga TaxID=1184398 RepID=UPI000C18242D|nr:MULTISPECIES: 30S ribosome-binding factor RbfA [unclassified Mesotoga]PNQ05785.1 ribosome-binding factor A [Mesotoga sp. SC_NapDC3]PXF35056.1 ribosome-binding factor A [Mesotoga sp. SC_NapDC]RAM60553.1 ribosome-binding factor A [Mesotoga sp. SC_4PWA21]RIZ61341.1 ribosome-binding factor A [Mesotoga sp. SC_NapDC2]HNU23720.1 30S ribosome-binding factor RbfA [Mesotoga sp.]